MEKKISTLLFAVVSVTLILVLSGCSKSGKSTGINKSINATHNVTILWFHGQGCPHCAAEQILLSRLIQNSSHITIKSYEVYYNSSNRDLLKEELAKYGQSYVGVPVTIIGNFSPIVGYAEGSPLEEKIIDEINYCLQEGCDSPK